MKRGVLGANGSNGANTLGAWLKNKCAEERLSLRQAAAKAGLSHVTISDIINGGRPSATTIGKLAEAFGNGNTQTAELKDLLLGLSGYRGSPRDEETGEHLGRVMDKLKDFSPKQLEVIEDLAGFITGADKQSLRGLRSSVGVLILPKMRLNFYLSFDDEETELSNFSRLPDDMQETIVDLAKRYEKEVGQDPNT